MKYWFLRRTMLHEINYLVQIIANLPFEYIDF